MNNYKQLKEELIKASDSYYKDSISLMSDLDFDMKLKQLEEMEKQQGFADPDSPTQRPGSDLSSVSTENTHGRPMLSLENTYNRDEVKKFWDDLSKAIPENFSIIVDKKWDGGSGAIRYKNGKVIKALSRGNGQEGEDLTQNVAYCDEKIWKHKNFTGEARGELIITKAGFEELNRDGKYQNARNLLSGSMKLLNLDEFKERALYIKFYAYWLEDSKNATYEEDLVELKNAGFDTGDYFVCKTLEEVYNAIDMIEKSNSDCAIDGAVLKLNEKKYWSILGSTSKFPRWAKAYKYKQEEAESTITDITFDVGRTGKISVLAWFDPVFIDGSTVTKATLNNKEFYELMDIAIGDQITIQKAAAIIPQITSVIERPANRKIVPFPTICPSCGSPLKKHKEEHNDIFCNNPRCKNRIINSIINYTHSIECDGFADIVVEKLYDAKLLRKIEDLYTLGTWSAQAIISDLDRMSENIAKKLWANIEGSKKAEFWKVIAGLGIPNIGPKMAKTLANKFKTMKVLRGVSQSDLEDVEDIAEITATSIIKYFQDPDNQHTIEALEAAGVTMAVEEMDEAPEINLQGKTFCITGALSLKRDTYIDLIEKCGGKVVGGVSRKTNYLITNDKNSGSNKNRDAQFYGIPILNEKELLEMCNALNLLKEIF